MGAINFVSPERSHLKKPPTAEERRHMGRVACLGCCVSGCDGEAEVHHIRDQTGMGQRSEHFETIPLCFYHHRGAQGFHYLGKNAWERIYGLQRDFLNFIMFQLYGEKGMP